ncbi:unnamed protein product [Rhodiola kirilowii]
MTRCRFDPLCRFTSMIIKQPVKVILGSITGSWHRTI